MPNPRTYPVVEIWRKRPLVATHWIEVDDDNDSNSTSELVFHELLPIGDRPVHTRLHSPAAPPEATQEEVENLEAESKKENQDAFQAIFQPAFQTELRADPKQGSLGEAHIIPHLDSFHETFASITGVVPESYEKAQENIQDHFEEELYAASLGEFSD